MKRFYKIFFTVLLLVFNIIQLNSKIHTPTHYEYSIRQCFNEERWDAGKYMLDEAEPYYGTLPVFYELKGWYYYHEKDYTNARYNLTKCLLEDNTNTHARTLIERVEEDTENWSDALCYINELLETNPYSKGLWNRKIYVYRQLHNDMEADRCLERLRQIYPNDEDVKNNLADMYASKLKEAKDSNNVVEQLSYARGLIDVNKSADSYLSLTNALLQNGRVGEAADICREGYNNTKSDVLLRKYIGILCDQGRYYEAQMFLGSCPNSASKTRLLNQVQEGMADYANKYDPYTAYGRLYEKTHSIDAFNYLINTALLRGYYDDALTYIKDWRARNGDSEDLLYKEYVAYSRIGNTNKAEESLLKLYQMNPNNSAKEDLVTLYYTKSAEYMNIGEYYQAIDPLTFVINETEYDDIKTSASNRLYTCYIELNKYDDALSVLQPSDSLYNIKKADILAKQGKYSDALKLVKADSTAYAEMVVPYIKSLMDKFKYNDALTVIDTALTITNAKELYMYGISSADIIDVDNSKYIEEGYNNYPYDEYFINQYAGLSNKKALALRKNKEYDDAMSVVDSALIIKKNDKDLLYTKGLLFEDKHMYDSAYVYQKNYNPSQVETYEFKKKVQSLMNKSYKNSLSFEYLQYRYGSVDAITSNATVSYSHKFNDKNAIDFTVNYAGRDDGTTEDELLTRQVPGGIGLQFNLGYEHTFKHDWTWKIEGGYATKYFPEWNGKLSFTKELPKEWVIDGHFQYRKLDSYSKVTKEVVDNDEVGYAFDHWNHTQPDMFNIGLGVTKTVADNIDLYGGVDGYLINSSCYFAVNTKFTYRPLDISKTNVFATAGFGTAPEMTLIDTSMPSAFEKINSHVGMGCNYMLTQNLTLHIEGDWHTLYKQSEIIATESYELTTYANLYYIYTSVIINF